MLPDLKLPALRSQAAATGTVDVTMGYGGGFGNNVQVHIGNLWVRYAHMKAVLVGDGDVVAPVTVVALEGQPGSPRGRISTSRWIGGVRQ